MSLKVYTITVLEIAVQNDLLRFCFEVESCSLCISNDFFDLRGALPTVKDSYDFYR